MFPKVTSSVGAGDIMHSGDQMFPILSYYKTTHRIPYKSYSFHFPYCSFVLFSPDTNKLRYQALHFFHIALNQPSTHEASATLTMSDFTEANRKYFE